MSNWQGIVINRRSKLSKFNNMIFYEYPDPTEAEVRRTKLRSRKRAYQKKMESFWLAVVVIFGIIPFITGLSVGGALLIAKISCSNVSASWGILCGLIGFSLYIVIKDKWFDKY